MCRTNLAVPGLLAMQQSKDGGPMGFVDIGYMD